MVFNFTIRGGPCLNAHSHITLSSSDITCYVGADKHENEFLIKYGWPGDIWFHVDSLSSAHVYFRVYNTEAVPVTGIPIDDLPADSIYDMMQIVKNNSISGCKLASTRIVYTPHSNLKKTFQMESGTVTYHDTSLCRYGRCDKDKNRVRELEKTKTERLNVDFFEEMKANERRIVARKKLEKEQRRDEAADAKESSMDRQHEDKLGLYDPIRDDIRAGKIKASRMGDDDSGVDRGLAALEGLSFATTSYSNPTARNAAGNLIADTTNTVKADGPVWVDEEESRALEKSENVRFLRARGYDYVDAVDDLNVSKSPIVELKTLWHSTGLSLPPSASDSITAEAAEARQEEKEVLMAIFGEDDSVSLSDDETGFDAIFPITSYEPPSRYGSPPPLLLEVYVDDSIAPLYPYEPPVLALVGGGIPETLLKELTNRLRVEVFERCKEEPGLPQIFNVLTFVGEEVEKIIEEETVELDVKRKKRLEEEKAEAERKRKAEADERKMEEQTLPSESTLFKNDAERRAYANEVISKVSLKVSDNEKKQGAERYNTGVSDESLIKDLFG
jgi:hypothetical protein